MKSILFYTFVFLLLIIRKCISSKSKMNYLTQLNLVPAKVDGSKFALIA